MAIYYLQRVPDGSLISFAESVLKNTHDGSAAFDAGDNMSFGWDAGGQLNKELKSTFSGNSFLINSATIKDTETSFTLKFYRGKKYGAPQQGGAYRWLDAESPFVDGIDIDGPSDGVDRLATVKLLNRFLSLAPPAAPATGVAEALDQSSLILHRVSDAAATVVEYTAERQRELDRYKDELEQKAADRLAAREASLDVEHQEALAAVQIRAAEVTKRLGELDDRENTHVRRELQKNMAAISTDTLGTPLLRSSQASFTLPIAIAVAFAVALLAIAAAQSFVLTEKPPEGSLLWFAEGRIVLLGAAAGALIFYALRLSAGRFRQVSRWENDLNRFRLDTERASFLIEGDLEARKLTETGLPEVMVDRFSRGLFSSGPSESDSDGDDVGSTLGHLLGRAALVKLGTDGVSVEVDKAGLKRARRDIAREGGGDE